MLPKNSNKSYIDSLAYFGLNHALMSAYDDLKENTNSIFGCFLVELHTVLCDTVRSETPAPKTETLLVVAMHSGCKWLKLATK